MAQESLRALLAGLVDYAGLFPPSQLSMAESVRNYAAYLRGDESWILGRFVVPVARLDEFTAAAAEYIGSEGVAPWRLTVLAPADYAEALPAIATFNERHRGARIDCVEWKAASTDEILRVGGLIPPGLTTFVEIPHAGDPLPWVKSISEAGAHAKFRTGGLTPEVVPPVQQVLAFLEACDRFNVSFKATAGLHHPIRAVHSLTYQPDSPVCQTHGFLNVFMGAAFLRTGVPSPEIADLLAEESVASFSFNRGGVTWRGHWMSSQRIRTTRERFAIAFGSCSFEEPLADLREAGLL